MNKLLVLILVIAASVFGFHKYQEHLEIEMLTKALADTTARASTTIDLMRGGHGVSIADFIKQTEGHNQILSNHVIAIKSNINTKTPADTAFALLYIEQTAVLFRSAIKLTRTIADARTAKSGLEKTIDTLQNFINNPANERSRYAANTQDVDSVSHRAAVTKAEFDVAVLKFQLDFFDLSKTKPPPKSKIPATVLLGENDFRDVSITLYK